jgi:glycogen debranching enzyme
VEGQVSRTGLSLRPAKTPSIADALTLKHGDLFLVTESDGDVPVDELHATGLYYHDCRFLDGYELRLAGERQEALVSTAGRGYQSLIELTNPELVAPDGRVLAPMHTIGIKWSRTLDSDELVLRDAIRIRNNGEEVVDLPVSFNFRARFQDVFSVRLLDPRVAGRPSRPRAEDRCLHLEYHGADDVIRRVTVCFEESPDAWEGTTAVFSVSLGPREEREIQVIIGLSEEAVAVPDAQPALRTDDQETLMARHAEAEKEWRSDQTGVRSSSLLLDSIIDRSVRDLYLLRSCLDGEGYYAAGVPWFATLFGRDSIISALQTLAFDTSIARQTLRILAKYQGVACDPWREEQPGKILHELRVGELARTKRIPHSPYYGSIDATPLFLVLVAEYFAWSGDRATIEELEPNVQAALRWLEDNQDDKGYLSYCSNSPEALVNQGWKDSANGIPNADGTPAEPPIALAEVQAYAYLARVRLADMYRRLGCPERAEPLERQAEALRKRFNEDFWIDSRACYALALQKGGRPTRVRSSNSGHCLWAGIAEPDLARRCRKRLMRPDMFTGWGIRTLSNREVAYSPVGYHLGSVWPHDNSLIMDGFRRYGFDAAALELFSGMMRAAMHFNLYRLPELFAGFSKAEYEVPVNYPLASKPQAWSAGAMPFMLAGLLGLRPEANLHRLNVVSPVLPPYIDWLELNNLSVGPGRVDLRFQRTSTGVAVEVRRKDPPLQVVIRL